MLSPGKRVVPRGYVENLAYRRAVQRRVVMAENRRFRDGLVEICRHDLLFWVNVFVWQYNPVASGREVGPFVTWGFQDKALTYGDLDTWGILGCVEDQKDLAVEKSREMGASWMFLIVARWLAGFQKNKQFLMVSRSAEAVDDKSKDSLFWKLDFIDRHLPEWLRGDIDRTKMYFGFRDTGSEISGEASTGRAGVGGRATAMFIDEFAQIKEDRALYQRSSDTAKCRIFNSTHVGMDTAFYDLTHPKSGLAAPRKLVLHWSQHPEKRRGLYRARNGAPEAIDRAYHFPADYHFVLDGSPTGGPFPGIRSPWYDEQGPRKGSARAVAEDLDINPSGSVEQFFDPLEVRTLIDLFAVEPYWQGEVLHEAETGRFLELHPTGSGRLKLWCHVVDGKPPPGRYVMAGDLSTGVGTTNSVLAIVEAETGEKVGEYANPHLTPDKMGLIGIALGQAFGNALVTWEERGPGIVFGQEVIRSGYPNVWYRVDEFDRRQIRSDKPGWAPGAKTKRLLLEKYRSALRERRFLNRSRLALEECLAFKYAASGEIEHGKERSDDPSGARVNHADRVIADALAWMLVESLEIPRKRKKRPEEVPLLSLAWRRQYSRQKEQEAEAWI